MIALGPLLASLILAPADGPKADRPALDMTPAVACRKVDGFEDYTPLPDATLTSEDKLLVYYRPVHYKVETFKTKKGDRLRAKFSQDGQVRRKGEKKVLMKKDRMVEFEPVFEDPDQRLYMTVVVGLKGLPPGDYEFDIILRDELEKGSTRTQSVPFTIKPVPKAEPAPKGKENEPTGPEGPAGRSG